MADSPDAASIPQSGIKPPPLVLAFLACDDIIPDARNGNHSIINVFHDVVSPKFPCVQSRMSIFVELTNGHGFTPLEIRYVYEPTQQKVFSLAASTNFPDPREVGSLVFQVAPVLLASPGEYRLQLYGQSILLIERRITAHLVAPGAIP